MKTRSLAHGAGWLLALACPVLLPAAEAATPPFEFVNPDEPAVQEIRRLGERSVDQVGAALLGEVKRVLADTTPALAVAKLHLKEYKPPPARGRYAVTAVRRTSLRVRSEANAPDEADRAALEKIQRQLEEGDSISRLLLQKISRPGQPAEWRVYRPLGVPGQCLVCHGSAAELAEGVPDTLKTFFPKDQAVGYTPGAWRGVLRVSIAETPAKN
jgi:Protein of unknown function (DUF3365)